MILVTIMGDLAVVAEFESYFDSSNKSKRMSSVDLSSALHLMGISAWSDLEPGRNA